MTELFVEALCELEAKLEAGKLSVNDEHHPMRKESNEQAVANKRIFDRGTGARTHFRTGLYQRSG